MSPQLLSKVFIDKLRTLYIHNFKETVARYFCCKLRLWGVRLGPTDDQRMRVFQEDAISFTSTGALFKRSKQIKGTVYRC